MNSEQKDNTCDRCRSKFLTRILLDVHLKEAHVEGGEYSCGECSCIFKQPDKLNAHQVEQHGYIESVPLFKPKKVEMVDGRCKFCRITFHNTAMLKSHLRRKHADEYESSESDEDEFEDGSELEDVLPNEGLKKDQQGNHGMPNGDSEMPSIDVPESKDVVDTSVKLAEKSVTIHENHVETASSGEGIADESTNVEKEPTSNGLGESTVSFSAIESYDKSDGRDVIIQSPADFDAGSDQNDDDFEPPTNFLIQNDYEVEPEEAQIRSSNIEQLINSIEDDDTSDVHRCHLCSSDYATLDALRAHNKTNHVVGGQFPCENCACVFASRPELIVHSEIIHRSMPINHFMVPEFVQEPRVEEQPLTCDLCGQEFSVALQLTIHKMRNHVARGHKCRSCSSSFMSKAELTEHIQEAHGQYKYIPNVVQVSSQGVHCTICNVDYKSNSALRNHTKSCHVPNGRFPCSECPCVFSSSGSLHAHFRKHKKARVSYNNSSRIVSQSNLPTASDTMQICACEICGVNFINTLDYLSHKEESHVADGQFSCQDCPCIFSSFENLKTHRNVFHGQLHSPGILVSEMRQSYETSVTSFDPKIIQVESTNLSQPTALKTYSVKSPGSTKEICNLCGATLRSKLSLKSHLEKSHVPNGFKCNICSCSWATYHAVKTHIGQFHKGVQFSEEVYTPPLDIEIENHVGTSTRNKGKRLTLVGEEDLEFKCTECDWTLADATDLQNHKIQFHGFKPNSNSAPVVDEISELIKNDDPLTCSACNLTFKRPSETYSHRKRYHVTGGKFPCKWCKCVFGTGGSLQAHEVSKHTDEMLAKPPPHKKSRTSLGIITNSSEKKTPSNEEFVCNLCGRSYSVYETLRAHKSRSHKPAGVACSYCTCMFSNPADLSLHNKKYHRQVRFPPDLIPILEPSKRGRGRPKSSGAATNERFTCQYKNCHVICRNQSLLSTHVKKFHSAPIEVVVLDDAFKCEICNISFGSKQELSAHRTSIHDYDVIKMAIENATVTPDGKYRCHFCSTVFSRQSAMVAHVKTFHMDENKLLCFDCSEEFSEMSELEEHRRLYHDVVKTNHKEEEEEEDIIPIITSCTSLSSRPSGYDKPKQPRCELCGRVFLHSRSLWSHRKRSHVTEGDFTCAHCSCGFATSRGLKNHQLIYHGIRLDSSDMSGKDGPWMIDCDLCDETFTSTRRLKSHQKRAHANNGEYACSDCYNVYETKCSLNVHRIKIHGVELPPAPVQPLPEQPSHGKELNTQINSTEAYSQSNSNIDIDSGYSPPHDLDYEPEFDNEMDTEIIPVKHSPARRNASISNNNSDRKYTCDFDNCNLKFGLLKFLISHRKMRHDIEEKQCPVCNEVFPTMDALVAHTEQAHSPTEVSIPEPASTLSSQEYQCDMCQMIFSLSSSLNMHKTTSHVKNGKFPCPFCPCVFGNSSNLSSHKTVHALRDRMKHNEKNSPQKIEYKRALDTTPTRRRGRPSKMLNRTASPQKQQVVSKSPPKPRSQITAPPTQRSVARKKTSLPPGGGDKTPDILGLAFTAAMNDSTPRCATCKKTDFTSASAMRKHENECRKRSLAGGTSKSGKSQSRTPNLLSCKLCPKKFTLGAALKDHMHKKHNPDGDANAPSSTFVEQIDLDSDGSDDAIPVATTRRRRGTPVAALPPPPTPPPPSPPPPPKKKKTKFPCKECNIIFPHKRILQNHVFICHVKTGVHNCDECTCKFNIALGLQLHKKHAHKYVKKAAAIAQNGNSVMKKIKGKSKKKKRSRRKSSFEKGFFSPKALKSRERLISWNEVMHPCKVCAMKFRFTTQLARHENINHPGQPEYLCEKCPSMTSLTKELKYHEEIYHSHYLSIGEAIERRQKRLQKNKNPATDSTVNPVKPKKIIKLKPLKLDENLPLDLSNVIASYTCTPGLSIQDELRIKENFLRRKLKRRKGIFMCRVCRMMFFTKRGLSFHLRVHVGEKPFKCRYCGVLFRHYGPYLMHKKKHVALQPRVKETVERNPLGRCSYCKATFRTVTLADIHFEEVHPELKFLDMCEQASNLWKETSVLKSGDNFQLL